MRVFMRHVERWVIVVALLLAGERAFACISCNCGDTTLTTIGIDKPYRNRIRLALEERVSNRSIGAGVSQVKSLVLRSSLLATWAPIDRLTIGLTLPWISGWLNTSSGQQTVSGLGDFEMSARFVLWRDRKFSSHHLIWSNLGLKFPTGPRLYDGRGYPLADDDQPGTGSYDPFFGATYGWFGNNMTVFASVNYRVATPGYRNYQRGSILGYTALAQFQPWSWGAFAIGVDGSWLTADVLPSGVAAPNTGGWMMQSVASFFWSPFDKILVRVGFSLPIARVLNGIQSEGPQAVLALVYDVR